MLNSGRRLLCNRSVPYTKQSLTFDGGRAETWKLIAKRHESKEKTMALFSLFKAKANCLRYSRRANKKSPLLSPSLHSNAPRPSPPGIEGIQVRREGGMDCYAIHSFTRNAMQETILYYLWN